jgi:hypothetical protein
MKAWWTDGIQQPARAILATRTAERVGFLPIIEEEEKGGGRIGSAAKPFCLNLHKTATNC